MMGYYSNPVSAPEEYGFIRYVTGGELEPYDYAFYEFVVLAGEDGYYLTTDSGCSCPSPFESHTVEDFTGPLTAEQVREEVLSLWATAYSPVPEADILEALAILN